MDATGRTLLCVDDEPNILSALRRVFHGTGYRLLTADSGAQALATMAQEPVDLIVSDMRIGTLAGQREAAEELPRFDQGVFAPARTARSPTRGACPQRGRSGARHRPRHGLAGGRPPSPLCGRVVARRRPHRSARQPARAAGAAARILAIADAFADLQSGHLGARLDASQAATLIARGRGTMFDPEVVDAFLQVAPASAPAPDERPIATRTEQLVPGMVLARDLVSTEGVILLAADRVLDADLIQRIRHYETRDELTLVLFVKPTKRARRAY